MLKYCIQLSLAIPQWVGAVSTSQVHLVMH